jgi:hypothetical protein
LFCVQCFEDTAAGTDSKADISAPVSNENKIFEI